MCVVKHFQIFFDYLFWILSKYRLGCLGSCADLSIVKAKLQFCRWFINSVFDELLCHWKVAPSWFLLLTVHPAGVQHGWLYRVLISLSAVECSSLANARRFSISSLKICNKLFLIFKVSFVFVLKRQFSSFLDILNDWSQNDVQFNWNHNTIPKWSVV